VFSASADATRPTALIVVFVSGVEAYTEAVHGLGAALAKASPTPTFIDLKAPNGEIELGQALGAPQQRIVITIGSEALASVNAHKIEDLVIPSMILRSDRPRAAQSGLASPRPPAVYLDLPLTSLINELRTLLPGKNRLGIIRNSSRAEADPSVSARVRQQGFTLDVAECSRPEDLVKSFLSLKGKADFVVVLPDSTLYNSTTVRPLILASLESRLPIVGFSSSFVRAGAAVAIYPDFKDIGWQTADLVQKLIAGRTGLADESPRKLQVAVNQRVLRLLGLNCNETPGLVIFR